MKNLSTILEYDKNLSQFRFCQSVWLRFLAKNVLKKTLISTYSAGNAVSKGKLDICESADSGAKNSLGDAKIVFNFGCPKALYTLLNR